MGNAQDAEDLDHLGAMGKVASNALLPTWNHLVCDKGIKAGKADWRWLESQVQGITNNIKKCPPKSHRGLLGGEVPLRYRISGSWE